ncbi:MAG TPA: DUF4265 domain-containing protein [Polyangia bacterium]
MSWTSEPDGLDKLRVDLPNHPHVTGETLWAQSMGNNLYEIRNVPFHAYGLNFLDIVVATTKGEDGLPTVEAVRRRSGHRTIRVCFTEDALDEERLPILLNLHRDGGTFEGASSSYYAIDVAPEGNWERICDTLATLREHGVVTFEMCESPARTVFDVPAVT